MSEPIVQVEDLHFAYPDGTRAIDGVSFQVAEGERVALAGPNGAGKSTLLLHLAGALDGTASGRIAVAGIDLSRGSTASGSPPRGRVHQVRRLVGLVFQNPDDQLFCPTVFEDVAFGPRNMRLSEDEVRARVGEALAAVGLAGFERRSPLHLSLGEKKRAAIATVLAMRPRILALDEPTSMLDPRGRREVAALLEGLGGTQIVVTHDLDMVRRLCGRVLVISAGRVVADGPPADVFADRSFLETHGLA